MSGYPHGCHTVPTVPHCPHGIQGVPIGVTLPPWDLGCPHWCHTLPTGITLSPWVPHCPHGFHLSPPTRGCPLGATVSPLSPEVSAELPRALPLLLGDSQHVQQSQRQALLLPGQAQPHGHAAPDEITAGLGGHRPQGGPQETPEPCWCHPRAPRGSHPAQAFLSPLRGQSEPALEIWGAPCARCGGATRCCR